MAITLSELKAEAREKYPHIRKLEEERAKQKARQTKQTDDSDTDGKKKQE